MPHDTKAQKLTPRHFAYVINAYLASPKFAGYAENTRIMWRRELLLAARPDKLGTETVNEIRPSVVQAHLDWLSNFPGKQAVALAALRQVEKWAVVRDMLPRPITMGCEVEGSDGGHIPWSDEQVALGEAHARPDLARVITLAANTGQRGSDLIKMRWTDIEVYEGRPGINVTQKKTGRTLWVPTTEDLQRAMAGWERRPGFILLKPNGKPWTRNALTSAWVTERATNLALAPLRAVTFDGETRPLVLHGLRGTACVRLLRHGANSRQISDMVGISEEMVRRYTRFSEQRKNAMAAVHYLDSRGAQQGIKRG